MINQENKYTKMQKDFYEAEAKHMAINDHKEHNANPDYWHVLLGVLENDFIKDGFTALDFGCGTGRNVHNLINNCIWKRVDGVDISAANTVEARKKLEDDKFTNFNLYVNNGVDLSILPSDEYNFVMSTIVFQHISVHEIRYSLMSEIFRVLKKDGVFSFQMGVGTTNHPDHKSVGYFENYYDAQSTNSGCDVMIENPADLVDDLEKIGFKNVTYVIKQSFSDNAHPQWIYVNAVK